MKSALSQKKEKTQPNYLVPVGFFMFFYAAALSLAEGIRTHASVISFQLEYFIPFLGWLVGVLLTQRTMRAHLPNRDPWIFPLVAALSGWGILMIWRLSPLLGLKQLLWFLFGLLLVIVGFHLKNLIPTLRNYKYLWLFGGLLLIGLTFVAGVNPTGSGPKLWLEVFGFYIQPSEPLKLLMVIFLSAFFADQLRPNVPLMASILPTLLVTGLAGLLLIGQRDLGTAALFVCIYALMLTITTRRRRFLWLIPLLALVAGLVGYFAFDVVRSRVDIWLNPWLNADGAGYQLIQARIAVAAGGLIGTGPGLGSPQTVPVAVSDFIFTAIAEETGLLGMSACMLMIVLLAMRGMTIAQYAKTSFGRYLAFGISAYLSLQALFIAGGNLGLFPLTGITLPFLSYGGSSLVTNLLAVMILLRISTEPALEPLPLPSRKPYQWVAAGILAVFAIILTAGAVFAFFQQEELLARPDNPRWAVYDRFSPRGDILTQSGQALVTTSGSSGNFERVTHYVPLSNTLGYAIGLYGQTGIEQSMYPVLRGEQGIPYQSYWWHKIAYNQPPPGLDVRLNLNLNLQKQADALLGDQVGAVVLLNARTGEIYALASHPYFDANTLTEDWEQLIEAEDAPLLNRTVQASYPLGTLLNTLALGAYVSESTAATQLPTLPSRLDAACYQAMTAESARLEPLKYGCEASAQTLADMTKPEKLVSVMTGLGIFSAPEVVLQVAPPAEKPDPADYDQFVQTAAEIKVSPLQMALVAAAITNDGLQPAARLANSYQNLAGEWVAFQNYNPGTQALTVEASRIIREILTQEGSALWHQTGHAASDQGRMLTWYIGGTSGDWQGTPLAVAIAIEDNQPALAQQIGSQLLNMVTEP